MCVGCGVGVGVAAQRGRTRGTQERAIRFVEGQENLGVSLACVVGVASRCWTSPRGRGCELPGLACPVSSTGIAPRGDISSSSRIPRRIYLRNDHRPRSLPPSAHPEPLPATATVTVNPCVPVAPLRLFRPRALFPSQACSSPSPPLSLSLALSLSLSLSLPLSLSLTLFLCSVVVM
jgi:hypothetical protein